jgi:hypothetical protein
MHEGRTMTIARRLLAAALLSLVAGTAGATRPFPILFVTQVPTPVDFTTVASTFGNHLADEDAAPRGGDLWILYPDGTQRNLTQAAGLGVATGFQDAHAIAVRDPAVDWSGTKAIFSMVVGAPSRQFEVDTFHWQLYEITNFAETDTGKPAITKVPYQPTDANNVSPAYLSDGRILFASDRTRTGAAHLYPQRDEYEEAPTVSGLWALDPASGALQILDHAPSGDFKPTVDSFGRVIFTRWDHLQRDQQADDDALEGTEPYGTFNWSSEAASSAPTASRDEVFPEPRDVRKDLLQPNQEGHSFNEFFPWMMSQDGSGLETLNHVGRHDLLDYFDRSFNDDGNLHEFICGDDVCGRVNQNAVTNMLQIRESPKAPGTYYGTSAPEFATHAAGQVVSILGEPGRHPDNMPVTAQTDPHTSVPTDEGTTADACHSGLYRDPLPLADGTVVVVHAGEISPGVPETRADQNIGTDASAGQPAKPASRYKFRLRTLVAGGCNGTMTYGAPITTPIVKSVSYWNPDQKVAYDNVTMWELDPVEVRKRDAPADTPTPVPDIEKNVFTAQGVDLAKFQLELEEAGLALIISRNVTTRDHDDIQQPFNLTVPGGTAQTIATTGKVYGVNFLQLFQADQIRGLGGVATPKPGRRVLAQPAHDPVALAHNPPLAGGAPPGSTPIAADGSMVAMVPSHRAMTWQLTSATGTPVVRERYWLTFKPGEVRVCTSCHGLSSRDQVGDTEPINPPQALQTFLHWWTVERAELFRSGFEAGGAGAWSSKTP